MENIIDKYVESCRQVLKLLESSHGVVERNEMVQDVVETAKRYLSDAEFYRSQGRLEVSLASVAYCEGLLDALRILRYVEFEW